MSSEFIVTTDKYPAGTQSVELTTDTIKSGAPLNLDVNLPMDLHAGPGLIKSASIVSAMMLISRLLGFMRDIILAQTFGAGPAFDAFVVAFKIPNFLRRLFGEGAFAQALVPILAQYRAQQSHGQVQAFINKVMTMMSLMIIVIIAIVEVAAPVVVMVFAPGFRHDPLRAQLATHMLHIIFPYLLLIVLSALAAAILNTYHRFALPAVSSVMLNIALIAVAWWWAPHTMTPIYVLAWGVIIGGVLQLMLQLPSLYKLRLLPKPQFDRYDVGVRKVMKKMLPALFGVSVAQLSVLFDNLFASFLPAGSISWLYYSDRLTYLPLGLIGAALATVVMPALSNQHNRGSQQGYIETLDWALRWVLVLGVPAAVGLVVLAGPLIATLIQHGAFNAYDVFMTRKSLAAYALGLPAFMLIKILAAAFYSRQNIALPVKIALIAMVTNMILNVLLMIPLAHAGLALATALAAWLNAVLLLILLIGHKFYRPQPGWFSLLLRVGMANVVMAVFLGFSSAKLMQWITWATWQRALHLLFIMLVAISLYFLLLALSGMRWHHLKPPA